MVGRADEEPGRPAPPSAKVRSKTCTDIGTAVATTVALINMKGGVGKTTLAFNLAWYSGWHADLRVLAVDLDPQSNLSQYFMGARRYLSYIRDNRPTIAEVFQGFTAPSNSPASASVAPMEEAIYEIDDWGDRGVLHLLPSRLELSETLREPSGKIDLLAKYLSRVADSYDLILIDCPPTESVLTTAAYRASRRVVVPVRPEPLGIIGLPLLARSLREYRARYGNHDINMAGIIFVGGRRSAIPPEQRQAIAQTRVLAKQNRWRVFENVVRHSDSYPRGSRAATPIFQTKWARDYVRREFRAVGAEFLRAVRL